MSRLIDAISHLAGSDGCFSLSCHDAGKARLRPEQRSDPQKLNQAVNRGLKALRRLEDLRLIVVIERGTKAGMASRFRLGDAWGDQA